MTQDGKAEVGDQVFFFASVVEDAYRAGKIMAGQVIRRPTTTNVLDLWVLDDDVVFYQVNYVTRANSLEQCLEIGNCWASKDQLIAWGVELHNGDQDLTQIEAPE